LSAASFGFALTIALSVATSPHSVLAFATAAFTVSRSAFATVSIRRAANAARHRFTAASASTRGCAERTVTAGVVEGAAEVVAAGEVVPSDEPEPPQEAAANTSAARRIARYTWGEA
jgi:hypothetical protein